MVVTILLSVLLLSTVLLIVRQIIKKAINRPEISIGNAQSIGTRKEQEDAFSTIKGDNGVLAVLADGMGGLKGGKEASNLVVRSFLEEFSRTYNISSATKFLINTTYISNAKVLEIAKDRRIGTTLVAVLLRDNRLDWVSVGDSQIYLYRNNELMSLNEKHIYANELKEAYAAGEISRHEALNHPKRERLTSYLGYENFSDIYYSENPIELLEGDKVILCSDGVSKVLSEFELESILSFDLHPMESADKIIEEVLQKHLPNQDNSTIVILTKNK